MNEYELLVALVRSGNSIIECGGVIAPDDSILMLVGERLAVLSGANRDSAETMARVSSVESALQTAIKILDEDLALSNRNRHAAAAAAVTPLRKLLADQLATELATPFTNPTESEEYARIEAIQAAAYELSPPQKKLAAVWLSSRLEGVPDQKFFAVLNALGALDALPPVFSETVANKILKKLEFSHSSMRLTTTEDPPMVQFWETTPEQLASRLAHGRTPLPGPIAVRVMSVLLNAGNSSDALLLRERSPAYRKELDAITEEVLDTAADENAAAAATSVLLTTSDLTAAAILEVAKKPTCIGKCVESLLERAESLAGKDKFKGNRWEFASWARQQGLDLEAVPYKGALTRPQLQRAPLARMFTSSP